MDNDELYNIIRETLTVSYFSLNLNDKGKNRAMYLERILYICPVCNKMHEIYTDGNYVYCKNCGLKVLYNEKTASFFLKCSGQFLHLTFVY